jgi:hypothetical protein
VLRQPGKVPQLLLVLLVPLLLFLLLALAVWVCLSAH